MTWAKTTAWGAPLGSPQSLAATIVSSVQPGWCMSQATSSSAASRDLRVAMLHARWRWSGLPLLVTGVVLLLWAFTQAVGGQSGWTLMLSVFGTGLGLASFGANHDTAMASALRVRQAREPQLPDGLAKEIEEELERDREGALGLRPAPRVALVIPLVGLAVQCWVLLRLVGA
jgi:hypothetical protein